MWTNRGTWIDLSNRGKKKTSLKSPSYYLMPISIAEEMANGYLERGEVTLLQVGDRAFIVQPYADDLIFVRRGNCGMLLKLSQLDELIQEAEGGK